MVDGRELAGFTVAVTAARRADELASLLERRGAQVVHGPALRIVPLSDDTELRRASRECIADPPDVVVATTGIGFRGWIEAAEGWGVGGELREALGSARLLARGPKARGAVRAAGLPDPWSPASESSAELLEHLHSLPSPDHHPPTRRSAPQTTPPSPDHHPPTRRSAPQTTPPSPDPRRRSAPESPLAGRRVAVQLHGRPLPDFVEALRLAGAHVIEVPVYRWTDPADPSALENLLSSVCAGEVDAVTFTSAPAAASLLSRAADRGRLAELVAALRGPVLSACVGPVTHRPLAEHAIPAVVPSRYRLGALVRALCEALPDRCPLLPVGGHRLQLRGHAAVVDGALKSLSPQGKALLRALADRPGRVVSRRELADALGGRDVDEHAVEQAVARLRASLGEPGLVQTVIKRGYRLPLEPMGDTPLCRP
ncbi:uroporphyrinogen-III synthase [Saccharopolyspora rosea]|uniref:uroporphyrinogen-III synthase n=1 Tax=Saccharopolyspora rosea TaxID=524884 RepID=UPI0021D9EEF9|nr:uroporphyrinogen-III synthase [Saccharopolyspora rosea]